MLVLNGKPEEVWKELVNEFEIKAVYFNHDYEPYAIHRDKKIAEYLTKKGSKVYSFKDHVFFEKDEITKADGLPYTVYTAYKNKWLEKFKTLAPYHPEDEKKLRENYLKVLKDR